jgi:hypothetical protein
MNVRGFIAFGSGLANGFHFAYFDLQMPSQAFNISPSPSPCARVPI